MTAGPGWLARMAATIDEATPGPWHWEGDYPDGHCPHDEEWTDHGPDLHNAGGELVTWTTGYDASSMTIKDADAAHIAEWCPANAKRLLDLMAAVGAVLGEEDRLGNGVDCFKVTISTDGSSDFCGCCGGTWPCLGSRRAGVLVLYRQAMGQ